MKKVFLILLIILLVTGCGKKEEMKTTKEIVATMQDKIGENAIWCGTFQLIWNDLKKEYIKKDIDIPGAIVENLNKETFKESDISDEYYYKKYGIATKELKSEIENDLKEKFNQKSEILDDFNWQGDLFFYTMLYREFQFEKKFDVLSNNDFNIYKDIKYFGISPKSDEQLGSQIKILSYENDQNFIILLKTKTNDEIILYKNPNGNTFEEIYNNMNEKIANYQGSTFFSSTDEFKMPMLDFNYKREYEEVENKIFLDYKGDEYLIYKAIQTIQFELNEKGGKIKSEAGMGVKASAMPMTPKKLYLNDTFAIFLKEETKEKPYFAAKITDITKFSKK